MGNLQVLVATMKQEDFSLLEKMNIKCRAVVGNQYNTDCITVKDTEYGMVKMITTSSRGVGLNRNIALMAADAEYLLFSDDDMVYYDGTLSEVEKAFNELPDADIIIFSTDILKNGVIVEKRHLPKKRRHIWNSLKYGTYAVAVRRRSVINKNITFSQLFGGGCIYGAGEDSLFLIDALRKGLHVYSHSYVLGTCNKDKSSWFEGYNKKFFFDKGAFWAHAFPHIYWIFMWNFALKIKMKKRCNMELFQIIIQMHRGARAVRDSIPYTETGK